MCFEKTQWLQSQTEKRKPCAAPKVYLISNNQGFHTAIINHWQISLPHLCLESKKIATVCLGEIDRPATPANRCWTLGCTSGIRVVCCSGGQAGSDLPNHCWLWRSLLELRHCDGCEASLTGTKEMVPLPYRCHAATYDAGAGVWCRCHADTGLPCWYWGWLGVTQYLASKVPDRAGRQARSLPRSMLEQAGWLEVV